MWPKQFSNQIPKEQSTSLFNRWTPFNKGIKIKEKKTRNYLTCFIIDPRVKFKTRDRRRNNQRTFRK